MGNETDERLLFRLVSALSTVPGVRAIVLGGSRARRTATVHSDYDIGLYYEADAPLDVVALGRAVAKLDDNGPAASVTAIGDWGPWINGGGWLTVEGQKVDLLYRDLARVRAVIEECLAGEVMAHYQPGHPHAFVSAIYVGEIAYARSLHDPTGALPPLLRRAQPYPEALREGIIRRFAWEAPFALQNARKSLERSDITYISSCCSRSVACLCQVLFAVNGQYLLNEKGSVAGVERLERHPTAFVTRVTATFRDIGLGLFELAVERLEQLVEETTALQIAS